MLLFLSVGIANMESLAARAINSGYIMSAVDPVITFLGALLRANYETTGVSSKKTGGTSIKIIS